MPLSYRLLLIATTVHGTAAFTFSAKPSPVEPQFLHRKPARTTSLVAASLPSVTALAAASFLPTCLGFWKTGYAVSYGYGGAIALCALLTLGADGGLSALASTHALALVFYGVRLCLFLL